VKRFGSHDESSARIADAVRRFALLIDLVRTTARTLIGADGVTFVLRDGDFCYYVEEDALGPLWKGQRFPVSQCVSGWVMTHGEPAVIPDIYEDARVPHDTYRHTFVRSMAMVPIGAGAPVGAIGAYWAAPHRATETEINLLVALAQSAVTAAGPGEPE
jgi:GAF domain-containing protein